MQRTTAGSRVARSRPAFAGPLAFALLVAGLTVGMGLETLPADAAVTSTPLLTRDIGGVPVTCNGEVFISSLNTDDDNHNDTPDRAESLPLRNSRGARVPEDNLREFIFDVPEATRVYIAEVMLVSNGETAVGNRVRAYKEDKTTPFAFGENEVPITMYLEGKAQSSRANDIGFEYQYFKDDGSTVCGGFVQGTIVRADASLAVETGDGTPFEENHKMLITGDANAAATVSPADLVTPEWSYDAPGAVFTTPTELATMFTAPERFTRLWRSQIPLPRARVKLTATATTPAAQVIEAKATVILTAPRQLKLRDDPDCRRDIPENRDPTIRLRRTGLLDTEIGTQSRPQLFGLFNWCVAYNILDQEGRLITQSAYAGQSPAIRENIAAVLGSPIAAMQSWIRGELEHSPDWEKAQSNGRLRDRIKAERLEKGLIVDNGRFVANLRSVGGILMGTARPHHIWELSVRQLHETRPPTYTFHQCIQATKNTFASTVAHEEGQGRKQQINILSRYVVELQQKPCP